MDKVQVDLLRDIILNENVTDALEKIEKINDSKLLFALIDNYNWRLYTSASG